MQNQPGSDLVLADCVRFWPNRSIPEASQCARIIPPASGQCFPADPDPLIIGSGMFTGSNSTAFFVIVAEIVYHSYLMFFGMLTWSVFVKYLLIVLLVNLLHFCKNFWGGLKIIHIVSIWCPHCSYA